MKHVVFVVGFKNSHSLDAMKAFRTLFGYGLVESKNLRDTIRRRANPDMEWPSHKVMMPLDRAKSVMLNYMVNECPNVSISDVAYYTPTEDFITLS